KEIGTVAEVAEESCEVGSDVEDRARSAHREAAEPTDQRPTEVGVRVMAVGVQVERLAGQDPEKAVGQEVDVQPCVGRAPEAADDRHVYGQAEWKDQDLRSEERRVGKESRARW